MVEAIRDQWVIAVGVITLILACVVWFTVRR